MKRLGHETKHDARCRARLFRPTVCLGKTTAAAVQAVGGSGAMRRIIMILRTKLTSIGRHVPDWSEWDSEQWHNGLHRRDNWH